MAVGKEIRTQISSINNTRKITRAMEKVAASKTRKAQDRMDASRPYANRIRQVIGHLANANPEYKHSYLITREVKRVGYIIVSSDRGLCGGLNTNVFKTALKEMKQYSDDGVGIDICAIGNKAVSFFNNYGGNVTAAVTGLGDTPEAASLIGSIKVMLDAFDEGQIDRLFVVSNEFVNTMTQKPTAQRLLPLIAEETSSQYSWDYIYEPEPVEILNDLLVRYVESQVYQAVVENIACEQAARMLAMKNATDNAGEIIDQLQLVYNKARQAAITQEISEIVGGAAAV